MSLDFWFSLTLSKRQRAPGENKFVQKQEYPTPVILLFWKPITMMTLKLNGFCGCIGRWRKVNAALSGIKGIERKLIDKKKFLVTITGTVDTEALRAKLAKIRKGVKVEVIFQGDGEKEEEKKPQEEANTEQKEENPKEKPDTNQKMEEEEEQKENADKAEAKSEKTSPSTSNAAGASPSIRRRNSTVPMGEQNLEHEPPRFPCDYGFGYGPLATFGDGPYDYPQGHAHGSGPYNDPPPQDHDHDNGPNNDPEPHDHAHGNGPYNDPPPQDFAGVISNACSIM